MRARYGIGAVGLTVGAALAAAAAIDSGTNDEPTALTQGHSTTAGWAGFGDAMTMGTAASPDVSAFSVSAVERMPDNADSSNQAGWWVPLALYNGDSYFVYDSPDTANAAQHYLKIAKRTAGGAWTLANLKNADGTTWGPEADDVGHKQPTIAIDGNGYIHVWAEMHNHDWRYFRSSTPGAITDIRRRTDMPGSGAFTYPVAKTAPNGDVWLIIRNNARSGELYHWTKATQLWDKVATFATMSDSVVYPDDLVFASDGALNIVWEWAYNNPRGLRHQGSFLRYRPATNSWSYIDGTAATVPVSRTSSAKLFYLDLQPGEVFTAPDTAIGLQSAKIALDPATGNPTIAYRFRPTNGSGDYNFDVWRVRWNNGWINREKIYTAGNDVPAGLGLTRNATAVHVYLATLGGGMQRAVKTGTTPWSITALAPGKAVQRINVAPLNDTTDIIYGGAPTDINATTGSVYWQSASD